MERNDLTQGNIYKSLITYFIPLAAATIFQQLYNAVDALIVGRYVGTIALAAVGGSAGTVSMCIVNFIVALTGGASILMAQFFGAKSYQNLKRAVQTSMVFSLAFGIILTIFTLLNTEKILALTKTPADSIEESIIYFRIVAFGLWLQFLFNMAAGILRAIGDSKTPFIIIAICCVSNIVLDWLFIAVFQMGVAGAAIATVISQAASAILTVAKLLLTKEDTYKLNIHQWVFSTSILKRMLIIAVPLALQSLMYSITNVSTQVCVNILGTVVVASWGLSSKIDGFFWGFMASANTTISTFIGQNFGKRDYNRMKEGTKASFVIFEIVTFCFSIIIVFVAPHLIHFFDDDPGVIEATSFVFRFFGSFYPIWAINEVLSGALRGEGKTLVPFIITALSICAFRMLWLVTLFVARPSLLCVSACYPSSWVIADICMIIYYIYHIKHRNVVK